VITISSSSDEDEIEICNEQFNLNSPTPPGRGSKRKENPDRFEEPQLTESHISHDPPSAEDSQDQQLKATEESAEPVAGSTSLDDRTSERVASDQNTDDLSAAQASEEQPVDNQNAQPESSHADANEVVSSSPSLPLQHKAVVSSENLTSTDKPTENLSSPTQPDNDAGVEPLDNTAPPTMTQLSSQIHPSSIRGKIIEQPPKPSSPSHSVEDTIGRLIQRKLVLEKIIGAIRNSNNRVEFIVKWKGLSRLERISIGDLKILFPDRLIEFMCERIKWSEDPAKKKLRAGQLDNSPPV